MSRRSLALVAPWLLGALAVVWFAQTSMHTSAKETIAADPDARDTPASRSPGVRMQPTTPEDYTPMPQPRVVRQHRSPAPSPPHPVDRKDPWTGEEVVPRPSFGTLRRIVVVKPPHALDMTDPWAPENDAQPTWGYGAVVHAATSLPPALANGT